MKNQKKFKKTDLVSLYGRKNWFPILMRILGWLWTLAVLAVPITLVVLKLDKVKALGDLFKNLSSDGVRTTALNKIKDLYAADLVDKLGVLMIAYILAELLAPALAALCAIWIGRGLVFKGCFWKRGQIYGMKAYLRRREYQPLIQDYRYELDRAIFTKKRRNFVQAFLTASYLKDSRSGNSKFVIMSILVAVWQIATCVLMYFFLNTLLNTALNFGLGKALSIFYHGNFQALQDAMSADFIQAATNLMAILFYVALGLTIITRIIYTCLVTKSRNWWLHNHEQIVEGI